MSVEIFYISTKNMAQRSAAYYSKPPEMYHNLLDFPRGLYTPHKASCYFLGHT